MVMVFPLNFKNVAMSVFKVMTKGIRSKGIKH